MKHRILYNSICKNVSLEKVQALSAEFDAEDEFSYEDITKIEDLYAYLCAINSEEDVTVCGGDGTVNRLINILDGRPVPCRIFYYPMGTGNDFYSDVQTGSKRIDLDPYIKELPTVTVKGNDYRFINGVGYGIDGYCCEEGDRMRAQGAEKINYAGIAIKGLLFHFKPLNAVITVDGKEYRYDHVWLAPSMIGRYYGGGMIIAPDQDRLNERKELSLVVLHTKSALRALLIFPGIFKGKHVKNKKLTAVHTGREITVTFDRPTACQIDGETISDVLSYTARFGK